MQNILVTGGAGFIGANFVHYWRSHHPEDGLVVLDKLTYAARSDNLAGVQDCLTVRGDIGDGRLVRDLLLNHRIDTIVHFAAESHVDRSVSDPGIFVRTNVGGTQALLEAAKPVWLDHGSGRPRRFHHISTDEVFGSLNFPKTPPLPRSIATRPTRPMPPLRLLPTTSCGAYRRTYGLETTTSNCSNNYGRFQFSGKVDPLLHGTMPSRATASNLRRRPQRPRMAFTLRTIAVA